MFKMEVYYRWSSDCDFSVAISAIHKKLLREFSIRQASSGFRRWDHCFHITKSPTESYTCDSHAEFIEALTAVPYYQSFIWHNVYRARPMRLSRVLTDARWGVGLDYSKSRIEVAAHASGDLPFIERAHEIVRQELGLEHAGRLDDDDQRRKMLDASVFVARHFDDMSDRYYSKLRDFLTLLGFTVVQGEEYASESIPEKIKRRIDDQSILLVNVTGEREHPWLISEASYALGKGKHIVLLLESGADFDSALLGRDLEYVSYEKDHIESAFVPLLREFRSVGVRGVFF